MLVVLPLLYIALTDIKNVLGKNQIFLKKGLFLIIQSSDFSTRYQKKHSQKHFWGEEADARRLQILFLILAHYVCVLGCCCCCNNSCWVVNSLSSRHKPPENWAKTGSAFNQKVFLMTYNDVASIEKYLCISFTH